MQNPICVYCGTSRPANIPNCVRCGQPWIDHRVVSDRPVAASSATPASSSAPERTVVGAPPPQSSFAPAPAQQNAPQATPEAAAADTTQILEPDLLTGSLDEPKQRSDSKIRPLMLGFGIGLIIIAAFVFTLRPDSTEAPTTTVAAPVTTIDPTPATSLTAAPDTTTSTTTTTTTTVPPPPLPEAVGDPIAVSDLELAAFFIGPLDIGDPSDDVLGRLIATFGEPESHAVIEGALGLCDEQQGVATSWGPLAIVSADGSFVGYRLDDFSADHPAADIATLSGLRVGDT
ncbi:MAG: hypothetical protein KJO18_00760, partial [Acidimicrobiia bacterium]|nr:hypothetical protein [Acidimicrobiia bacterium]